MKHYLITSPEHYTQDSSSFEQILTQSFEKHNPEYALYRDKENPNYAELAKVFLATCQKHNVKAFLHQDVKLAVKLHADGIHLTSLQFGEIEAAKEAGLACVISTHTIEEVLDAQLRGADYVTYSPIFATPNKGEPKGVEDLELVIDNVNIKVIALGGIVEKKHLEQVQKSGAYAFASIRYFF